MKSHGYTGRLFEAHVIGRCTVAWDGRRLGFEKSVRLAKSTQPWECPWKPGTRIARILHRRVALGLGVTEWSDLELYTAVGSHLDHCHGVDCFFEFNGLMVTVDLTTSTDPRKDEDPKADIVVHAEQIDDLDAIAELVVAEFALQKQMEVHA